jgi:alcohol dehydrogenase YqhD (iron-dependent ADH family)
MDATKIIALAAADDLGLNEFWDKYFVRFAPVEVPLIPFGLVATASGTGSEGNGGAVITNPRTLVKTGSDHVELNDRFCIQDPELTYTVPEVQTVAGAYDSLNHMMEEYFSLPVGNNLSDDLLETAMRAVIRDLPTAVADPEDYESHANLLWASCLAENRLLKSGKQTCFQCHMIEHQVGAYTDCIHGLGLASVTSNYYRAIYDANDESLFQFKRFAVNVWGIDPEGKGDLETALAGIEALESWTREVGAYRTLTELGCTSEMLADIADSVPLLPSGFRTLTRDDVLAILEASM